MSYDRENNIKKRKKFNVKLLTQMSKWCPGGGDKSVGQGGSWPVFISSMLLASRWYASDCFIIM